MLIAGKLICAGLAGAAVATVGVGLRIPLARPSVKPARSAMVVLQALPEGGIQPQAAVDSKGIVHVVFFKGKPEAGNLYYYHFPVASGPTAASRLIRVNSQPETATAMGTIRTEQIAIGGGDRPH